MNGLFENDDINNKSKKISDNFLDNSNSFNQQYLNFFLPFQLQPIENLTENNIFLSNEEISSNDKLEEYPEIKIENKINTEKKIPITLPSTKEIIFKTTKIKKHKIVGRKKKFNFYNNKNPHTKKNLDNIVTKIKRKLIKHILKFINKLIKNSKNEEIKKIKLKIINNKDSIVYDKQKSLDLLDMTLKVLLSNKLSKKCKRTNEDYNKEKINFIFKNKENNLIRVFNLTFREILHIYCDDNIENKVFKDGKTLKNYCDDNDENKIFKDLNRLKDDIQDLKLQNEENSYIELYEKTVKNYEKIITNIISKKKVKKSFSSKS